MNRLFHVLWISILFSSSGAFSENVIIKRDGYGTPHIYAENSYDLFYGYGYSIAKDRLFQMEMAKRSTQGNVSEVLGKNYLSFDKFVYQNYDFSMINEQLQKLPVEELDIFTGYADGLNAWIKAVQKTPKQLMPKQFIDYGFEPEIWTAYDVAMIFVGTMINRYGDYNSEIENQRLLNDLMATHSEKIAKSIFDFLIPPKVYDGENNNITDTIENNEWSEKSQSSYKNKLLNIKTIKSNDLQDILSALTLKALFPS